MTRHDVFSICNALIDLLIEIRDDEFAELKIEKGIMHLVEKERQRWILDRFKTHAQTVELGGSAMNSTRTLALLGARTAFFGAVGEDTFGTLIEERMRAQGITSYVSEHHEPTGTCVVLITEDSERTMNTHLGASCHYSAGDIPADAIKESKILHVTGYQWSTPQQREAVKVALDVARAAGVTISFDVADPFVVRLFGDDFRWIIQDYADLVFANAQEAEELFGKGPGTANEAISKAKATAVLKMGSRGAMIIRGKEYIEVPAQPTTVVDTTAAGDMFAGGFLWGHLNHKPLETCGRLATLLASDVISRIGATLSPDAVNRAKELLA